MFEATTLFYWIATVEWISLVVLSVGVALVYFLPRPIERLRTIQATMVALVLACLLQAAHVLPQASLGWLADPTEPAAQLAATATLPQTGPQAGPQTVEIVADSATSRPSDTTSTAERPAHAPGQNGPFVPNRQWTSSDGAERSVLVSSDARIASTNEGAVASSAFSGFATTLQTGRIVVVVIMLCGATWSLLHLLPGMIRLRRVVRNSRPAPAALTQLLNQVMRGESRAVSLRVSPEISVPVAFGARRRLILLPEAIVRAGDDEALRYCLAHEWSHVRNHDVAQWWALQLCQSILWCQPLYWILRRELRVCQDQIADDFAAREADDPLSYAQLLIDLARQARGVRLAMALTMADGQSSLARRIRLLTDGSFRLTSIGRPRVLVASALVLLVAAFGAALVNLSTAHADDTSNVGTSSISTPAPEPKSAPAADKKDTEESATKSDAQAPSGKTDEPAKQDKKEEKKEEPKEDSSVGVVEKKDVEEPKELKYFGVVIDKSTKNPIEGAKVVVRRSTLTASKNDIIEETKHTTNERGVFRFVIPAEQVAIPWLYIELDVEHAGYAPKKGFGYALSMIRKNMKNGEPPFFTNTELDPAEPLTGRIVDPAGKPLAGVALLAYSVGPPASPDKFEYGSFMHGKSDEEGRFHMNLVKGGNAVFWIAPDQFAPRQIILGTKKGDLGDVQMAAGVTSSGQVVDAEGKPVAGVWVDIEDEKAQSEIGMPVASALHRSCKTDADGRFAFDPVKPGRYRLKVEEHPNDMRLHSQLTGQRNPKGPMPAVFMSRIVTLEDPPQPLLVQAAPHVLFAGQYFDSKGKTCRGHEVMIFGRMNGESFFTRITPDDTGRFEGKLPHGLEQAQMDLITNEHSSLRFRIGKDQPLLRDPHSFHVIGTIDHDVSDVEIVRYVAPIVTIKVVDEAGGKVPGAKVAGLYVGADDKSMISPVGGLPTNITFERQLEGRFRSSQMLPDEKTRFIARADGYTDAEQELTLAEGETKELTLVLKRAAKPADDGAKEKAE